MFCGPVMRQTKYFDSALEMRVLQSTIHSSLLADPSALGESTAKFPSFLFSAYWPKSQSQRREVALAAYDKFSAAPETSLSGFPVIWWLPSK
jgi:hypothetical protein